MRKWHSLYELMAFPISLLTVALVLLGVGNLLTNPLYAGVFSLNNDLLLMLGQAGIRLGTFLLVNFPLLFLIRAVVRKGGSGVTVLSAFAGYVAYLVLTMYLARTNLPTTAYSSVMGLSMTTTASALIKSGTYYPLQTGLLATFIVAIITLLSYKRTKNRSEYSLLGFIPRETSCVLKTVFWCALAGAVVSLFWPSFINFIQNQIGFIASDTTNPVNLGLYGILDRLLGVFNLGTLVRYPFWYGTSGGSWISMGGTSIAGDANIWTTQVAAGTVSGMTGRFFTPYYVLNIFAIPGLLWGMFSMQTDRLVRRREVLGIVLMTIISLFSGCLLPVELTLLLLCPLLFLMHVGLTGVLFGVLQSMGVYLGFCTSSTLTLTALPGTLSEFLVYVQNPALSQTIIKVLVVGVIMFFVYFLMSKLYFKHLALDLFRTGVKETTITKTVEAVGGAANIKLMHSGCERLVISLHDPTKLNVTMLRSLGAARITETKAGYAICFGAASTMIRLGIEEYMKENLRSSAL